MKRSIYQEALELKKAYDDSARAERIEFLKQRVRKLQQIERPRALRHAASFTIHNIVKVQIPDLEAAILDSPNNLPGVALDLDLNLQNARSHYEEHRETYLLIGLALAQDEEIEIQNPYAYSVGYDASDY